MVYVIVALVMVIASFMPWLDPKRVGPFTLMPYLWNFGVLIIPNLIFIGALLCLLAVATRQLLLAFLGTMALLVMWLVAGALLSDIQYDTIGSLIDPFGARARLIVSCATGRQVSATRCCRMSAACCWSIA